MMSNRLPTGNVACPSRAQNLNMPLTTHRREGLRPTIPAGLSRAVRPAAVAENRRPGVAAMFSDGAVDDMGGKSAHPHLRAVFSLGREHFLARLETIPKIVPETPLYRPALSKRLI